MDRYTKKKQAFLVGCADWTVSVLNKADVQEFVELMLIKEGIPPDAVRDVRVMVLPPQYRVRGILHGTLHLEAKQVSLYPVLPQYGGFSRAPNRDLRMWEGEISDPSTKAELTHVSIETLFHELLHLKYPNDEQRVRKLASIYYGDFEEFSGTRSRVPRFPSG
ncbi:MAG: hypothetical protein OK422_01360 [Thaumarchaeota archaeon]|nr:hypothetical protein [Nitrososphaerota archaeon]